MILGDCMLFFLSSSCTVTQICVASRLTPFPLRPVLRGLCSSPLSPLHRAGSSDRPGNETITHSGAALSLWPIPEGRAFIRGVWDRFGSGPRLHTLGEREGREKKIQRRGFSGPLRVPEKR